MTDLPEPSTSISVPENVTPPAQPDPPGAAGSSSAPSSPAPVVGEVVGDDESKWDQPTKRTVIVVMLVAMVGVFWISRPVIPWLVIAGIAAYLLSPIVDLCQRLRIPRAVTTSILFILLLVVLLLTPVLLAPVLVEQLISLNFDVPSTAFRLFNWAANTISNLPDSVEIIGFQVPITGITEQVETSFQEFSFIPTLAEVLSYIQQAISTATNVVSSTAMIGVSVVGRVIQIVITFLIIFFLSLYLTKDAPKIRAYIEGLFPRTYQSEWVDLLRRMGYIWQAFFRGQLVLTVSIFLATWGALSLAGMPGALILAIVAGAFEIVPTVGPIIAMIPAVIVALIQGSTVLSEYGVSNFGFALITIGIYFIIQQLENNILVPRVIGRNVNLHPIVVICGVAIGFNVAGVLGALFAAPVIASLRVLGGYVHAKLLDYPPFLNDAPLPASQRHSFPYRRTVTGEELAESSPAQRESANGAESLANRQQAADDPAALPPSPEVDADFSTPSAVNSPSNRTGVENLGGDISTPGRLDPAV